MPDTVLVLNAGSSSIKFQLFEAGDGDRLTRLLRGQIEGIGTARPRLAAKDAEGRQAVDRQVAPQEAADVGRAQEVLGGWLLEHLGAPPVAVGHRVVHGGPDHAAPVLVDDPLLDRLEALVPLGRGGRHRVHGRRRRERGAGAGGDRRALRLAGRRARPGAQRSQCAAQRLAGEEDDYG